VARREIAYTLTIDGRRAVAAAKTCGRGGRSSKAVDIGETIGTPKIRRKRMWVLAKVRYEQGNFGGALALAKQASEVARRADLPGTLWTLV